MTDISKIQWHAKTLQPQTEGIQVTILPRYTKELMKRTTTRDVYVWGIKNGVIKRLPRKYKDSILFNNRRNQRLFSRACTVFVDIWNEFEDAKRKEKTK